jgi:hypothetical protein
MRRFIPVVLFCIFGIVMIAAVLTLAPVGDPHQPCITTAMVPMIPALWTSLHPRYSITVGMIPFLR